MFQNYKKMKIKGINYNFRESNGEFESKYVGFNYGYQKELVVLDIKEHISQGEGDKWYYDIYYSDESIERVFNPCQVFYEKE